VRVLQKPFDKSFGAFARYCGCGQRLIANKMTLSNLIYSKEITSRTDNVKDTARLLNATHFITLADHSKNNQRIRTTSTFPESL